MRDRTIQTEEVLEMEITALRVRPWGWHGQRPISFGLAVLCNEPIPELAEFRFQATPYDLRCPRYPGKCGTLYFAEMNGYVRFFAHDPTMEHGFDGSVFTLPLHYDRPIDLDRDPIVVKVKGPWSSRAGVMNRHFQPLCLDAAHTHDPEVWDYTKGSMIHGAVAYSVVQRAIDRGLMPPGFHLEHHVEAGERDRDGEIKPIIVPDSDEAMMVIEAYMTKAPDSLGDYTIQVVPDNPANPPAAYWYERYHREYQDAVYEAWLKRKKKAASN